MRRRAFFGFLASIPFVGKLVPQRLYILTIAPPVIDSATVVKINDFMTLSSKNVGAWKSPMYMSVDDSVEPGKSTISVFQETIDGRRHLIESYDVDPNEGSGYEPTLIKPEENS